jgi:NAD(P)-dependent dehydrogenase (short-subunit alcohol dehydrogenase family)
MKEPPSQRKVVLITGSSSGIGRACCERLHKGGHRVYGACRSVATVQEWSHVKMDVTDDATVHAAVDQVARSEGRIDALVHCAGVSLAGALEDTTIDEAKMQFETNFFGCARVVRAILPVMRRQAYGRIIVIGSIGGLIALPYIGYYSASKFALDGFVEALRMEVGPFGIEATVVHPGDFKTAISTNQVYSQNANASSPYFDDFQRTVRLYDEAVNGARPPEIVAREVETLLARRRLPVRSLVGTPTELTGVWLKSFLPSRGFEYLFRQSYGL